MTSHCCFNVCFFQIHFFKSLLSFWVFSSVKGLVIITLPCCDFVSQCFTRREIHIKFWFLFFLRSNICCQKVANFFVRWQLTGDLELDHTPLGFLVWNTPYHITSSLLYSFILSIWLLEASELRILSQKPMNQVRNPKFS